MNIMQHPVSVTSSQRPAEQKVQGKHSDIANAVMRQKSNCCGQGDKKDSSGASDSEINRSHHKSAFHSSPGGRQNPDPNDADYVIVEISLRLLLEKRY